MGRASAAASERRRLPASGLRGTLLPLFPGPVCGAGLRRPTWSGVGLRHGLVASLPGVLERQESGVIPWQVWGWAQDGRFRARNEGLGAQGAGPASRGAVSAGASVGSVSLPFLALLTERLGRFCHSFSCTAHTLVSVFLSCSAHTLENVLDGGQRQTGVGLCIQT